MPASLAIHAFRARTPAQAQPVAARLALQALGADLEDALPRGLPPQALLWLRRLQLQAPEVALLRPAPAAWRQDWIAAGRASFDTALAQAARPALGPVPELAPAVVFADAAEMLACLALAAQAGQLDRWWWRGLLGRAWPQWQSAWAARPEARTGALRLLGRVRQAHGVAMWAEAAPAAEPAVQAAADMGRVEEAPPPASLKRPTPVQDEAAANVRSARAFAPERVGPHRASVPGHDSEAAHATEPAARASAARRPARQPAATAPAEEAGAHAQPARPSPRSARVAPDAAPADRPAAPSTSAAAQPDIAAEAALSLTPRRRRVEPARAALPGPGAPADVIQPRAVAAPPSIVRTAPADPVANDAPPAQAASGLDHVALEPWLLPPSPSPLSTLRTTPPPPRPAPVEDAAALWPWPVVVLSRQAPLLFVVNALIEDGLYPDFTRPRDRGLPVPLWALLAALARAWRLPADDPLQAALVQRCPDWAAPAAMLAAPGAAAAPWPAWLAAYARALRRRLCRRLGLRAAAWPQALALARPARLWLSEAEWVAEFDLSAHDVAWRLAGLDRDPGWLPSVGCTLRFRFEC